MDIISEVAKNANVGIDAIDSIKEHVADEEFRHVILGQRAKLADIKDKAVEKSCCNKETSNASAFESMMMKGAIKMKAMMDKSNKNIAEMLIEGYSTGINDIVSIANGLPNEEVTPLVGELINRYQVNIKQLRQYL